MSAQLHPVRIEVYDDLRRSRPTVLFRIILAIPHIFAVIVWTIAAIVAGFANWIVTLIAGTPPRGLHSFLTRYVRYTARVGAYIGIASQPWPAWFNGSEEEPYPIELRVDGPARQNRWKTLFRIPLALPALMLAGTLGNSSTGGFGSSSSGGASVVSQGAGLTSTAAILSWFYALATGRAPRGMRDAVVWATGYTAQTYAYLLCITDRYPYAGPTSHLTSVEPPEVAPGLPRIGNHDDLRRSRLTTFFRLPLAIPHLVWLILWGIAALVAAVLAWFAGIATGRVPGPLARFLTAYVRYQATVYAFLLLVGNPFPGFTGTAGSYPVDVRLAPPERQPRLTIAFRLILAIPALFMSSAYQGVLLTVGVLGWFASLATTRMPSGLQEAGAVAVGYSAQASAYLLLVTGTYPNASPLAILDLPPATPAPPASTSPDPWAPGPLPGT